MSKIEQGVELKVLANLAVIWLNIFQASKFHSALLSIFHQEIHKIENSSSMLIIITFNTCSWPTFSRKIKMSLSTFPISRYKNMSS